MKPGDYSPTAVRNRLHQLNVTPSKGRGQNFLLDPAVVAAVASFAGIAPGEHVVEVGPGLGVLTQELLCLSKELTVIEIEKSFCSALPGFVHGLSKEQVLHRDALGVDLASLGFSPQHPAVVVSNVPYSISTDFVLWLFKNRAVISRASLLLQSEFAARLAAAPGGRTYGSLTVMRSRYADAQLGIKVPGEAFYPQADVASQLVKLTFRAEAEVGDEAVFERVVRAAFALKRKTITNSLTASDLFESKAAVTQLLHSLGIDPGARAEALSLESFVAMAKAYSLLAKG